MYWSGWASTGYGQAGAGRKLDTDLELYNVEVRRYKMCRSVLRQFNMLSHFSQPTVRREYSILLTVLRQHDGCLHTSTMVEHLSHANLQCASRCVLSYCAPLALSSSSRVSSLQLRCTNGSRTLLASSQALHLSTSACAVIRLVDPSNSSLPCSTGLFNRCRPQS